MDRRAGRIFLLLLLALVLGNPAAGQVAKNDIDVDQAKLIDLKTIRLDLLGSLKRSTLKEPVGILLLGMDGEKIDATIKPSDDRSALHPDDPDAFDRFLIMPPAGKRFSLVESYTLLVQSVEDVESRVKPTVLQVGKLKGILHVIPLRPDRIELSFDSPGLRVSGDPVIQVKRKGSVRTLPLVRPPETGGNQNMIIFLNPLFPVQHGDMLTVSTLLADDKGQVTSTLEIKAPKPKDKASSLVFISMTGEGGKGQDPAIGLDLKVSNPYLVPLKEGGALGGSLYSWSMGPAVEAEISSTDKNNTNRFANSLNFRGLFLDTGPDKRWQGFIIDTGPKIEFDTGFSNRNVIASFLIEGHRLGQDLRCPLSPNVKDCWIVFRPSLGAEGGTNFGLQDDHKDLEDYSISRVVGGLYFSWTRKFQLADLNAISFSIDGKARQLFEKEADFEPNPGGRKNPDGSTSSLVTNDGLKAFGKATLSFAISENFAISLEYSQGERPPLFKDEDKVKLTFALAF